MDQPCLQHSLPTPGYDNTNPRPVCSYTFCLASMKKMVFYLSSIRTFNLNQNKHIFMNHSQKFSTDSVTAKQARHLILILQVYFTSFPIGL
jgi:hypothetical protein